MTLSKNKFKKKYFWHAITKKVILLTISTTTIANHLHLPSHQLSAVKNVSKSSSVCSTKKLQQEKFLFCLKISLQIIETCTFRKAFRVYGFRVSGLRLMDIIVFCCHNLLVLLGSSPGSRSTTPYIGMVKQVQKDLVWFITTGSVFGSTIHHLVVSCLIKQLGFCGGHEGLSMTLEYKSNDGRLPSW